MTDTTDTAAASVPEQEQPLSSEDKATRWKQIITEHLEDHKRYEHGVRALYLGIGAYMIGREARMFSKAADGPGFHVGINFSEEKLEKNSKGIQRLVEELFDRLREANSTMIERVRDLHQFDNGGISDPHVQAAVSALRENQDSFDAMEQKAKLALEHYLEFDAAPETDEADEALSKAHKKIFHAVDGAQGIIQGHQRYLKALAQVRDEDRPKRTQRSSLGDLLGAIFGDDVEAHVIEVDLRGMSPSRFISDVIKGL